MSGVRPTQVGGRKKQTLAGLPDIFGKYGADARQKSSFISR